MRVIHVAPTLFGDGGLFGGGERYPLELARAQASHLDCRLVTFGAPVTAREPSGLERVVLRPFAHVRSHPAHPLARGLSRAIESADVVHVHQMRAPPCRAAALSATLRAQTKVVTDHGLGGGGWAGILPKMFDMFACVSRHSAETLGAPPGKTRIVYGGADPKRFRPVPGEDRAGALFVGRLTPHKGVDRLIRALPAGRCLRVVGTSGHDRRSPERHYPALLEQLALGKDVHFVGGTTEDELPGLYRRASVFVLPSVHETCYGRAVRISELLSLSALEAMASGTPVIASRVGGLPEVVVHGETGFLVEPGDLADLSARLDQLLGDTRLARALGDNARQHATESFTWDLCARRCTEAYEEARSE